MLTNEPPEVMFKKVMEIPDSLIIRYYELVTDEHPDHIDEIRRQLEAGRNPRDCKLELARVITGLYHNPTDTLGAEEYFRTVYQKGEVPENMPVIEIAESLGTLFDLIPLLVEGGYVSSGSEFRRLVQQGGVQLNQEKVKEPELELSGAEWVLKLGKKKFVRIIQKRSSTL